MSNSHLAEFVCNYNWGGVEESYNNSKNKNYMNFSENSLTKNNF